LASKVCVVWDRNIVVAVMHCLKRAHLPVPIVLFAAFDEYSR
jgi:hypothetical protein